MADWDIDVESGELLEALHLNASDDKECLGIISDYLCDALAEGERRARAERGSTLERVVNIAHTLPRRSDGKLDLSLASHVERASESIAAEVDGREPDVEL